MSQTSTLGVACAGFFALGAVTGALGPALPELADRVGGAVEALGVLVTANFLGAALVQFAAGPLNDRFGQRPVLAAGTAVIAVGIVGTTIAPSLGLMLAAALLAGLGYGAVDVSTNVLVAELFAARSTTALNLLNVFFGVGAVAGPALGGLTLRLADTALPPLWLGAALFALESPLALRFATAPRPPRAIESGVGRPAVLRSPVLWAFGALSLIYVGIENGFGVWAATYMRRSTSLDLAGGALVASGFWGALTVGRLISVAVGLRLAPERLLLLGLGVAMAGGWLLVAATGSVVWTIVAALILGLGFGPIFPTNFALTTARFPLAAGTAASAVIFMGAIGGQAIPWLQGIVLKDGGPHAFSLTVAVASVLLIGLLILRRRAGGTSAILPVAAGVDAADGEAV